MNALLVLIPLALAMGLGALGLFLWSLRSRQYEDLDGAAQRILFDEKDGPAS
ncbi:MAG: cbb3-type cytochrome oxidase assembly protein CcoS [Acetobacteraceae bacterium]|nr:cbb3-type cytochrome oxidase assembly protein CcoS [Acetobacteraceae bacterium]MDW8399612.1 cbb3-type cytochrome oxidase assembly protein CcoS [Acetobacteraceae bacterium]